MSENEILDDKTFKNLWLNKLSDKNRKLRLERAFKIIREVADKQVSLIRKFENEGNPDGIRFLYFSKTLECIWENADFALGLGKGKYRRFSFYPVRTVFENTFRLEYFTRQKQTAQNDIAAREILRICLRHYNYEKGEGNIEKAEEFKKYYEEIANYGDYGNIDSIKESVLEPFPNIKELTDSSKLAGASSWYFHYKALAELTHGKLMHKIITDLSFSGEHRRSLMCLLLLCKDVIRFTDFHLNGQTKKEVEEAIKKAEYIIKK